MVTLSHQFLQLTILFAMDAGNAGEYMVIILCLQLLQLTLTFAVGAGIAGEYAMVM